MRLLLALFLLLPTLAFAQIYPIDGTGSGGVSLTDVTNVVNSLTTTGGVSQATVTNIVNGQISYLFTNVVWVSKAGNDTTAARCRADLPCATVYKAKTIALAGDTIVILPGTYYNCTNLLKAWVNYLGIGDPLLTSTNRTNDGGFGVFDDRWTGAVTSTISGISILWSSGIAAVDASWSPVTMPTNVIGAVVTTNAGTQLHMSGSKITFADNAASGLNKAALALYNSTNSWYRFDELYDLFSTSNFVLTAAGEFGEDVEVPPRGCGIYWEAGDTHCDIKRIATRNYGIYLSEPHTNTVANFWFSGDLLEYGKIYCAGVGAAATNSSPNWKGWFDIKEVRITTNNVTDGVPIAFLCTGKMYVRAQKIGTTASTGYSYVQTSSSGSCEVWLDIEKVSGGNGFIQISGGGKLFARIQQYEDSGGAASPIPWVDQRGSRVELQGGTMTITNTVGGSGWKFQGGTAYAKGLTLDTSSTTNSCFMITTNGVTIDRCALICTNTVFSVSSNVNATNSVKIYNTVATSTATNKLTVQVGPFTVDTNVQ